MAPCGNNDILWANNDIVWGGPWDVTSTNANAQKKMNESWVISEGFFSNLEYGITAEPQKVTEQPTDIISPSIKEDKSLEPYYKALIKYYRLVNPWLDNNLDMFDTLVMPVKEQLYLIKGLIEEHKQEKKINNSFMYSIFNFYKIAYPEIFETVRRETEGATYDVKLKFIKERIKQTLI
ncbi:MAG: hypothetical protein WCX73_05075 [Candidatus Pacearchaeota archaeon]|jgi:hypothetical protein